MSFEYDAHCGAATLPSSFLSQERLIILADPRRGGGRSFACKHFLNTVGGGPVAPVPHMHDLNDGSPVMLREVAAAAYTNLTMRNTGVVNRAAHL